MLVSSRDDTGHLKFRIEELVDPVAKLMSKNNLQDQFARLVKVISMLSFHYGWQAKTEDSI
jgi:hypothetical protein